MSYMNGNIVALTGESGAGRGALADTLAGELRHGGFRIAGFTSEEVRGHTTTGFRMKDLGTGKTVELASIARSIGPRVGRYSVNIEALELMSAKMLATARHGADIVVVNEVGPMQLMSGDFKRAIEELIALGKPMLVVLSMDGDDRLVRYITRLVGDDLVVVTKETWSPTLEQVRNACLAMIKRNGASHPRA